MACHRRRSGSHRSQRKHRGSGSTRSARSGPGVLGWVGGHGHTGRMSSDRLGLITTDPAVLSGQAVIAGTRVPVSVVLDCLAAGMSAEQIIEEYPTLTSEGVQAAAAYGALLAREELVPLGPE